jgi:hypothetical protein
VVAAPNRLFPIDFFHGGRPFLGLAARFHPPNEAFLASAGDVKRWLRNRPIESRAGPLANLFNTSFVGKQGLKGRLVELAWNLGVSIVPDELLAVLSPYFVLLVKKQPG